MTISKNKYSLGFLNDSQQYANQIKNNEKTQLDELDLKKIIQVNFPENQYYKSQTPKKQIVLHHTVSGQGVQGDINWWLQTASRVATHVIIDWEGKIYQCYSSKYWGHHLGVKNDNYNNVLLNKQSIGVEIDSWGGLIENNGKWYPAKWDEKNKKNIPNLKAGVVENVQTYKNGFRGYYGFEKYTNEQLVATKKLLLYWKKMFNIDIKYNPNMWDVNEDALNGKNGLWTHVSYRKDKSDCHPQPELIDMLKSL
jgi:N-acetyl-anhydromuramyl-L-alanine amidase AmpD